MAVITRSDTPACFSATSESASVVYCPGWPLMVCTMRSSLRPALAMRTTESFVIAFSLGAGQRAGYAPSTASCAGSTAGAKAGTATTADTGAGTSKRISDLRNSIAQPSYRTQPRGGRLPDIAHKPSSARLEARCSGPAGYAKVESCGALLRRHICAGILATRGGSPGGSSQSCLSLEGSICQGSRLFWAGVAQLVEHLICNQRVGGSNPFVSSTCQQLQSRQGRSSKSWTDLVVLPARSGPQTSHHSFKAFSRTIRIRIGAGVWRQVPRRCAPGSLHRCTGGRVVNGSRL